MSSNHWEDVEIKDDKVFYQGVEVEFNGKDFEDAKGYIWSTKGIAEDQVKDTEDGRL